MKTITIKINVKVIAAVVLIIAMICGAYVFGLKKGQAAYKEIQSEYYWLTNKYEALQVDYNSLCQAYEQVVQYTNVE